MPKETYFNLPAEKRKAIDAAIFTEFSRYAYDAASVNRIVKRARIAKGSFYQYFEDKKDLYRLVIDQIVAKKMQYLQPYVSAVEKGDFFERMHALYEAGLQFARSQPQLQAVASRLLADQEHPVFKEIMQEHLGKSDEVFATLVETGIKNNDLRPDLNVALVAHMLTGINNAIADFHTRGHRECIDESYLETVDQMIDILRHGLSRPDATLEENRHDD